MALGVASMLLVFTGFWHMTEWLMSGRSRDNLRLIPVGLLYLVLGWMIALGTGGWIVASLGGLAAAIGGTAAFLMRRATTMRGWVVWTFVVVDVLVVIAVILGLLA